MRMQKLACFFGYGILGLPQDKLSPLDIQIAA